MKNKQAFTLIELLVVVLIIGILAAVALPQYQKAVERSKATQALTLLKSLGQAYEAHHLASGEWATTFDELAVDLTSWTGTTKFLDYSDSAITDTKSNGEWSLQIENIGQGGSTAQDIRIHRLTGKYKGAGFVIYFDNSSHTAKKQIVCNERITACREEYCFNLSAGDYCEKIIKGTLSSEASTSRSYTLP
ncbi:type IV pilin protein [Candidatus Avelusimicrobium caledoniensis]|uniref:type IV pilin protein n=1 Tax=Candidatus Avelusimicrobium caledoniensis TaxID=3416220 RepID=UPI003D10D49D